MKFNINDYVKVKLTAKGIRVLKDHHEKLKRELPWYIGEFVEPEKDKDGYSKFQLWDLMHTFGKHIYNGCEIPFETIIEIPEEEI